MVDYRVFYCVWAAAVVAQCVPDPTNPNVPPALLAAVAAVSLAASVFYNWFWRLVVFLACWFGGAVGLLSPDTPLPATYLAAFAFWAMVHTSPVLALPFLGFRKPMPIAGTVFVTGCDSGMGFWTAALLADLGYTVFAGCFLDDSEAKLKAHCSEEKGGASRLTCLKLDVTSDKSVADAAAAVKKAVAPSTKKKGKDGDSSSGGLVGIINCAGVGFNGPASYFPMATYQRQMDVNFFGYVRVVQALLPLLRDGVSFDERARSSPEMAVSAHAD